MANTLFGAFKPHEYGLVILPMVVVKRFHDCLLPTHQAVLDTCKKVEHLAVKEGFLRTAAGYQFYNTSPFTFETLRADPENINDNFRAYLNGFSDNVQDILARMNFNAQIDRMEEAGLLYQVIVDFCSDKADMKPEKISAVDMGYIFENLVQRFSESYNEEAGAHFTSRDIIYLMCDLLVTGDQNTFHGESITKTVYDMTMGTSQMLTCMEERLKQLDADADVTCFGQELNPFTFGIAKADMLIRGGDPDNMQFGDTLDDDKFDGYQFDYCISNPPFGIDWKREATAVEAEHKKGSAGRFGPRPPSKKRRADAVPAQRSVQTEARGPHGHHPERLLSVHRGCQFRPVGDPPVSDRKRLAGRHRATPQRQLLQHRHRHLHLDHHQDKPSEHIGRSSSLMPASAMSLAGSPSATSEWTSPRPAGS